VTSPAHGTLSGTAPNVTYTPAANYNGSDSFTFKVNDGALDSTPATDHRGQGNRVRVSIKEMKEMKETGKQRQGNSARETASGCSGVSASDKWFNSRQAMRRVGGPFVNERSG
jgi:hypothetical protein